MKWMLWNPAELPDDLSLNEIERALQAGPISTRRVGRRCLGKVPGRGGLDIWEFTTDLKRELLQTPNPPRLVLEVACDGQISFALTNGVVVVLRGWWR